MRIDSFETFRREIDGAASVTPGIDTYCSSTDWIDAAARAFHPEAELFLFESHGCVMPVARHLDVSGLRLVAPAEGVWGLASPLLGAFDARPGTPLDLLRACSAALADPVFLMLAGLPENYPWVSQLLDGATKLGTVSLGPLVTRRAASLAGGLDGYLARRSRKHRASIRRSRRLANEHGIRLHRTSPSSPIQSAAFRTQVHGIERASWKGLSGQGAEAGPMRSFTEFLIEHAARSARLRAIIAFRDGLPIGYLYGALTGHEFRGIQMSYREDYRAIGLGNLLQLEMIAWLCETGAEVYDLGTDMPYKARWAESSPATRSVTIIADELLHASPFSQTPQRLEEEPNRD